MKQEQLSNVAISFKDLGNLAYKKAWDLQTEIFDESVALKLAAKKNPLVQKPKNHLLICEHPPVYTLGKSGSESHLLLKQNELFEKSIDFYKNNRGGDITFHGPEQIVGYPILDLEQFTPDIKWYMNNLEEVIIQTLAEYNIIGERIKGAVGVWIDKGQPLERKICAFGVKTSRWITMHGWALNVNTDLSYFDFIVPCGIADKGVTSMEKELGKKVDVKEVKIKLLTHFEAIFGVKLITKEVC